MNNEEKRALEGLTENMEWSPFSIKLRADHLAAAIIIRKRTIFDPDGSTREEIR